jgi:transforming growth factor-beta-induced protein
MKNLAFYFLLTPFLIFTLSSCDEDDMVEMPEPMNNIVDIALDNGFNSLAAALTKAGLVDDLQADTELTVFAPTDQAFQNLLNVIGQESIDDVPASVLREVLLYHVVTGKVLSSDISDGAVTTLQGSDITLNTQSGITVNGVSVINPFDVEATNGVVHTINEVLVPESIGKFVNTILEPAYFNESFSTLVEAIVKADVTETLLNTPNLTVFAPDNAAFTASGINLDDVDSKTLATVLTYHVVGQKVMSAAIPREATTVNGNAIFFSLTENGNFINGNTEIKAVDIESGTGVIHVIDNVILPPMGNIVETAVNLSASGEFTSLIAALTRTANEGTAGQNLIEVLSGTGPFTVFAPTNEAFQAVLDSNNSWNTLNDIPLSTLITVLTYHVVPGRAYDKDLMELVDNNSELPTASGQNITLDLTNMSINQTSKIVGVNVNTTNGVIHVIDNVLLP